MNIYKITQTENNGYCTYSSAIVVAPSEECAKRIHPNGTIYQNSTPGYWISVSDGIATAYEDGWATADKVNVELIGVADVKYTEQCVLLFDYNEG